MKREISRNGPQGKRIGWLSSIAQDASRLDSYLHIDACNGITVSQYCWRNDIVILVIVGEIQVGAIGADFI